MCWCCDDESIFKNQDILPLRAAMRLSEFRGHFYSLTGFSVSDCSFIPSAVSIICSWQIIKNPGCEDTRGRIWSLKSAQHEQENTFLRGSSCAWTSPGCALSCADPQQPSQGLQCHFWMGCCGAREVCGLIPASHSPVAAWRRPRSVWDFEG